ncbi:auxin-responsive protein IAA26 isoform X1 [Ziziphus jujuba]|uniref:Auxin-responsive protein n=1 Tax=Ziziphus jujuba TaxID=326968 RepID=A0A6P4BT21_ZIZJJ|nr:auxin-responsive protein IAA26 isoform X1 [Ziziphus jujuba]XP_048317829.2 auxin-responsive protein IAA26 isoform X1 [Ziziphus jujuba]
MDGCSRKEEVCPQLLDLISKDREWLMNRGEERSHGCSEEKKLELRLGPPGGEDWSLKDSSKSNRGREESLLSLSYFSPMASIAHNNNNNGNQALKCSSSDHNNPVGVGSALSSPWASSSSSPSGYQAKIQHIQQQQTKAPSFLQFSSTPQSLPVISKEAPQTCCTKVVDLQNAEKKALSPASANTAVPNSSQKRTAPAPVVGWPPIRSFRKNLASSSSSKPGTESQNVVPTKISGEKEAETCKKGLFVKINMDGVPIGRKVDLKAYDSYEKLSSAVDELFRGLLAAQRDSTVGGFQKNQEEEKEIMGLLDGSGEYTLVYEDNEGDRMLVGDVPWHMFVSTVKRLRVLKSSELSALSLGSSKQDKMRVDSSLR